MEALAEPADDELDELEAQMHAELARRGLTLETWAEQLRAKAQAVIDRNQRARRMRALKIAAAGVAGLAAAAGVALALRWAMGDGGSMGEVGPTVTMSLKAQAPPMITPDAGADAPLRK